MKVLLSIKPEFAENIFNGSKKFEFRKSIFKDQSVNKIVVYVSSPIQKVIGEIEIDYIINEKPETIWSMTEEHAGISKEFFDKYFENRDSAYAIKIKKTIKYKEPRHLLRDYNIGFAPQSFIYLY